MKEKLNTRKQKQKIQSKNRTNNNSKIHLSPNELEKLFNDTDFIEAFISYIFTGITKFDRFITIKSVEEDSTNAVNDADQVYQFLLWAKEQGFLINQPPTNGLYQIYVNWNRDENPGGKPLKAKEFGQRVRLHAKQFGLKFSDDQIYLSKISKLDFNVDVLNKYFFNYKIKLNKYSKSKVLICDDKIIEEEIDEVEYKLEQGKLDFDALSYKELLVVYYLASLMNPDAVSFVKLLEETNRIEM